MSLAHVTPGRTAQEELGISIIADYDGAHKIVKRPGTDLDHAGVVAVQFCDPNDLDRSITLGNLTPDPESSERLLANLELDGEQHRIRVLGKHVREAARIAWEFIDEHPKTSALLSSATVAVMSLYVIRQKRSNET